MVGVFLERENDRFTLVQAPGASHGLDQLAGRAFDCVTSDYDRPGCTGTEFLRDVRNDSPEIPFILFTGKGTEEIPSDATPAGVTDSLQKHPSTDC
ncbi:response regulator [Haloplanus sp.]|uniref:response regulator n=1 Tax=Haloplanus sp. TaxID=1961696 RepID=UPI0026129AF8|nr:response regulator [Haloplanus sp.]